MLTRLGTLIGGHEQTCRPCAVTGVVVVSIFAAAAMSLASTGLIGSLGLSSLVVALLLGMLYTNLMHGAIPAEWAPGISFTAKKILRLAIVLYGMRLTFQEVLSLGGAGIGYAALMLASTVFIGVTIGRLIGMDRDTATLTASGAGVCGAAAVLSVEGALKSAPHKTAVAIATVVLFGTAFMLVLPILHQSGVLGLDDHAFAIFAGAVTHEVAQVAAIASYLPEPEAATAILAKMTRVLLLAPLVVIITLLVVMSAQSHGYAAAGTDRWRGISKAIPWYAFGFVAVVGIHSTGVLAQTTVEALVHIDQFLLVMAMTAIGMETTLDKLKQAGLKPFLLGALLALWLFGAGLGLAHVML